MHLNRRWNILFSAGEEVGAICILLENKFFQMFWYIQLPNKMKTFSLRSSFWKRLICEFFKLLFLGGGGGGTENCHHTFMPKPATSSVFQKAGQQKLKGKTGRRMFSVFRVDFKHPPGRQMFYRSVRNDGHFHETPFVKEKVFVSYGQ